MGSTEGRTVGPGRGDGDGHGEPADSAVVAGRRRLLVVALIVLGEALALAAFAVFLVVNLVVDEPQDLTNAVIETVAFTVLAVLMGLLAWGARRARRWSRGPIITTQVLAGLGVSIPLLQGDLWYASWIGVPLAAGCVVATLLLLTPATTVALYGPADAPDDA